MQTARLARGCALVRLCGVGAEDVAPKGLWTFLEKIGSTVVVDIHSEEVCVPVGPSDTLSFPYSRFVFDSVR